MQTFITERLGPTKLMKSFSNELTPFGILNKEKTIKTKNKVVSMKMSSDLYRKITMIAQKQSVDLKTLLKYPLGSLLLSLAEFDESRKKIVKFALIHKLRSLVNHVGEFPDDCAFIVDGMAAVRQMKVVNLTYRDFTKNLLKYILSTGRTASS